MIKRYIGYKNSQPYYEQIIMENEQSIFLTSEMRYFNGCIIKESLNIVGEKTFYTKKGSENREIFIEANGLKVNCYINGIESFLLNADNFFFPLMLEKRELINNREQKYRDYIGIYDNELKDEVVTLSTRFIQRNKNEITMVCPRRIFMEYTDDGYIKEYYDKESKIRRKLIDQ